MTTTIAVTTPTRTGRPWLFAGLAVAFLGLILYVVQLSMRNLATPWYLPLAATLGVIMIGMSLWRKRTIWRILGLVAVLLLAGLEWTFMLGTRLPGYAGTVAASQPFPEFTTQRVDGTLFKQRDLVSPENTVLVFFRGRW